MEEEILQRWFSIDNDFRVYNDNEIINYLKQNEGLYIILATGGMGKSFLAKNIWSKKLNYKILNSHNLKSEEIVDNIIIDNLDEVSIEKARDIIGLILRKRIKNAIVFSRPETFAWEGSFNKITFKNEDNINPRYCSEFEMKDSSYWEFEKHFIEIKKINENEFDFLSILSFKLLSLGVISINEYDLFEFIRKYNVNNATQISQCELIRKQMFYKESNEIRFKNKTIPSFFTIAFLKKFAHIKYSYLTRFRDYPSQVSFHETSQIIKKMGFEGTKLSWNLIKNNGFFFIFLPRYEQTSGLDNFFNYGSKETSSKEFTQILAKTQISCSNDKFFKGSIIYNLNSDALMKVDFEKYLDMIEYGIQNERRKYINILMFLSHFKNKCIENEDLHRKNIDLVKSVKIEKYIKNHSFEDLYYDGTLYLLGFAGIKSIQKSKYKNVVGPIENAIAYAVVYDHPKALELIKYFDDSKPLCDKLNIEPFIDFLITTQNRYIAMKFLLNTNCNDQANDKLIRKIGISYVAKWIELQKDEDGDYNYLKKIPITKGLYNEIEKLKKGDFHYQINLNKLFWKTKGNEKRIKDYKKTAINFNDLKNDIELTLSTWNFKYLEKYEDPNSEFPYHNFHKKIIEFSIAKVKKADISYLISSSISKLNNFLEKETKKYFIFRLRKFVDLLLQILFSLDSKLFLQNDFHPLVYIFANSLKQSFHYENYEDNDNWYIIVKASQSHQKIINYLSDFSNLEYWVNSGENDLLYHYLEKTLAQKDEGFVIKTLSFLDQKATNDNKYNLFLEYRELPIAMKAMKKMKWKPENFGSYIYGGNKMRVWSLLNKEKNEQIKMHIIDLFERNFAGLKENNPRTYKINWYDKFFGFHRYETEPPIIQKTIDFLLKKKLVNYFFDKLYKFIDGKVTSKNYSKVLAPFFEWLIAFGSEGIDKSKIVKKLMSNHPHLKDGIDRLWTIKSNELINKPIGIHFNIGSYYKYLNDDLSIAELKELFLKEIAPLIEEIANLKKGMGTSKFESNVQNAILQEKLPRLILNKYGVLLQPESNTYNVSNRGRIDFILSKNDKYLFVELKSSNDRRLNQKDLSEQLSKYSDSFNLINHKILIIFKIHNITEKKIKSIKTIARANDFDTYIVYVSEHVNCD